MHLYHSIQTLVTLVLAYNTIREEGAQNLAYALQHNTVKISFLFMYFLFIYVIEYRHLPRWNLHTTQFVMKELNI
jgi:hypothetical protein